MIRRRLAETLLAACARILPPRHADWARAMAAELEVIEAPGAALGFAFGCLWASSKERMFDMDQPFRKTGLALVTAMAGLALLLAFSGVRLAEVHGPTGLLFGASALLCAGAALWSLWRGTEGAVEASGAMLGLYLLDFIALRLPLGQEEWVNITLYRAVAAEGVVAWGVLFAAAMYVARLAKERRV